IREIKNVI
ncbi:unnamed protein product, partial [Rotaria sordida]